MTEADAADRRRLTWRCRRGMKELDLLLAMWLERHWDGATAAERGAFGRLLDLPDPLLAAYLLGQDVPQEASLEALVAQVRRRD